jgi:NAD(P)-dependent dehydrogenase (short-subunit alcohol dehydrogenase family)
MELAIVGRSADRVRATAELAAAARPASGAVVHEYVADLASLAQVRQLAAELLAAHPRIDVLANNAGAMFTSRHVTADGYEQTFALNHLSPFLLTALLMDRLIASSGRVVTTASDAHRGSVLDLGDLQSEHGAFRSFRTYGRSKLCNVLFTRELQRRHPGITATCFHPGVIRSGFGKNDGLLARVGLSIAGVLMAGPEQGGKRLVQAALDPAVDGLRGQYLERGRAVPPSAQAQDDALAAELWRRSEQLTGVEHPDQSSSASAKEEREGERGGDQAADDGS